MSRSSSLAAAAPGLHRPRSVRRILAAVGLALAVSLLPALTLGATSITYNVSGIQIGLRANPDGTLTSSFAGAAVSTSDGEFGLWHAAVVRSAFVEGSAKISGGTFRLKSAVRIVTGTFNPGGTVTRIGPPPTNCANEAFAVHGTMTAASGAEVGLSGTFDATLTHFQRFIFRQCRTLGASVVGVVNLALAPPGP